MTRVAAFWFSVLAPVVALSAPKVPLTDLHKLPPDAVVLEGECGAGIDVMVVRFEYENAPHQLLYLPTTGAFMLMTKTQVWAGHVTPPSTLAVDQTLTIDEATTKYPSPCDFLTTWSATK